MPRKRSQIHMDDKWIEDPDLEQLLEGREQLKEEENEAHKAFVQKDAAVKDRLKMYDFPPGEHRRCGGFIITKRVTESQEVTFTRSGGERLSISEAKAEVTPETPAEG